jgi:AcrR family transcriptional regulator
MFTILITIRERCSHCQELFATVRAMTGLRARRRASTLEKIKRAALDQIAADGASALSIRGVARAVGMSPAGLYRYYEGRDALLTDLLVDAYTDLAEAVEATAAGPGSLGARFGAAVLAYRRWAIDHPNRFLLIFGTPVPGYAAPEGGPTVEANRRMGRAFFGLAGEAWAAGMLAAPEGGPSLGEPEAALLEEIRSSAPGFPGPLIPRMIGAWAHWHGLVILEVTNQLHWIYPDPEAFFRSQVGEILARFGLQV